MKVGDLVQLSKYGRERHYNSRIVKIDPDQVGVVIAVRENWSYPYKIRWALFGELDPGHMRLEIKYAKEKRRK